MQDYDEIRRRYNAGESQRHIAKSMGISRNTVKKYCEGNAVPWERKTPVRTSTVLTEDTVQFIKNCLAEDADEHLKKQSHTAKRIYDRLVDETGFAGGESTIRAKVHELKETVPKAFIPLQFDIGEAMQVDWGEATVYLGGEKTTINIFCARLCYSCRPFVFAYHRQNEESFLDAFVRTFEAMGGVPKKVIFDNGRVAVKDGFGKHAKAQQGYTQLSAHYSFSAVFCNPAEGHEKGLVEGLVGWARRNILVPVPRVADIEELNSLFIERCELYESHSIKGKPATVGEMFLTEKDQLQPLPGYRFETAKCTNVRVNAFSTVRFKTNSYSVPVKYTGMEVGIKGYDCYNLPHYVRSLIILAAYGGTYTDRDGSQKSSFVMLGNRPIEILKDIENYDYRLVWQQKDENDPTQMTWDMYVYDINTGEDVAMYK
ncbi:MAG: IS21 family transposase [Lachnospiraceae bacterium]|nr:IS21 family transposase [Lachnospiraceae bacterium]